MTALQSHPEPPTRRTWLALIIIGSGVVTGLHLGLLHVMLWQNPTALPIFVGSALTYAVMSYSLQRWVFPRLRIASTVWRIATETLIAVSGTLLISAAITLTVVHVLGAPSPWGTPVGETEVLTITPETRQEWTRFYLMVPLVPTVMMTLLAYHFLWQPVLALEVRQRELATLAASAQLAALRAQINPHFLFNSLNSIAQLIHVDPDKAEACVERLAEIFRYLLRQSENELVSLAEEMAVVEAYLEIERARFGDRLRIEKQVDAESLRHRIPSLILQPLVENAVKHGLSRKLGPGTVRIAASFADGMLQLTVDDDGVGMTETAVAAAFERGVGLQNLRARMIRLYGSAHVPVITSAVGSGTSIRLRLPQQATV